MTFNPRVLDPTNTPAEWDPIDAELWDRIKTSRGGVLIWTPEDWREVNRIRASRWLLLRNDVHFARCGICNRVHKYVTLACIERPFNTVDQILAWERQMAEDRGLDHGENVVSRYARYKEIRLGTPEPINRKMAKKLMLRIRAKAGRDAI